MTRYLHRWYLSRSAASSVNISLITPPTVPLDLEIYETFRKYVQHEDHLVNQRISWMLMIHGFLYAAYALVLQTKLGIAEAINGHSGDHIARIKLHHYLWEGVIQIYFALFMIAFIGFVISLTALRSIRAARRAAKNVQDIFESNFGVKKNHGIPKTVTTEDGLILPTIAGGGDQNNVSRGIFSANWLPIFLMIGWVLSISLESFLFFRFYPFNR
ncbi:MAG TPA: hypothetical protein VMF05_00825 [Stellaceae bacterium]|nr:hypothetical protein [Stellaceae bacterium]